MDDTKKNNKSKKPAVAKSAAGSNNKIAQKSPDKSAKRPNTGERSAADKKKQGKTAARPQQKTREKPAEKQKSAVKQKPVEKQKPAEKQKQKKSSHKLKDLSSNGEKNLLTFIKKSGRTGIIAASVILAVLAAVIVLLIVNKNFSVPGYVRNAEFKGRMEPETIAFDMDISESQQKALIKATKAKGDTHKFDFFVNDTIIMNEYDDPALIEFGSCDSNDCVLVFYLLDENGNELYRSLGVEPGKQIRSVSFFSEIPYGTHEATIAVLGYNPKTYKPVGMQTASIKLEIGVD